VSRDRDTQTTVAHPDATVTTFSGDLAGLGAGPALQMLGRARATGRLHVVSDLGCAEFALKDGKVLWGRMTTGSRLGELLMKARAVDPQVLATALKEQRAAPEKQPLGVILAGQGHANPRVIAEVVQDQALTVLREVLHWTQGSYRLNPTLGNVGEIPGPEHWTIEAFLLEGSCGDE
jgi:hypothetical protein